LSTPEPTPPTPPTRHQNLYAHQLWMQQRFYAGLLLAIGLVSVGLAIYQRQLLNANTIAFVVYLPLGLVMAGGFLIYRRRSQLEILDSGVKVSNLLRSVTIDYDSIRWVKALPLRQHFEDGRRVVPFMKRHIDKPAVFIKVRGDESELKAIKSKLGLFKSGLMAEDVIAVPVPDADGVVWEISAHLPERVGQNQGGARRRKRRH
jgi:hypothetical protein